ncbi:unnamed protein product [Moneuplotes crassus]|uniref:Uncharacterized protein n=1 Tax=Euplotes crassus TaxID=5936 RepID=A0AAD1XGT8_EUPCR|nr:unnamed protein product [Moneuplotes crassus]
MIRKPILSLHCRNRIFHNRSMERISKKRFDTSLRHNYSQEKLPVINYSNNPDTSALLAPKKYSISIPKFRNLSRMKRDKQYEKQLKILQGMKINITKPIPITKNIRANKALSITDQGCQTEQDIILNSNPQKLQSHFTSLRKENLNLPALMKIKNTAIFRDYKRILEPLKHHQKTTKRLNQFLKSSYRKKSLHKVSDISELRSCEYQSVSCERSVLNTNPSDRSITPMRFKALRKPLKEDMKISSISNAERRKILCKLQHKIKSICQTSQGITMESNDSSTYSD